jgi:hypothetical protein
MTSWIHRQSSFPSERIYQKKAVTLQCSEVCDAIESNGDRHDLLVRDGCVNSGQTNLVPLPLDDEITFDNDIKPRRISFDRRWNELRHSAHLLVCLSVMAIICTHHPTGHAFQHHTYSTHYEQIRTKHRKFFRRSSAFDNGPSRVYSVNDRSPDNKMIGSSSTVKMMIDGDHIIETRTAPSSISQWEHMAFFCVSRQYNIPATKSTNNTDDDITRFVSTIATPEQIYDYTQYISVLRVMIPSFGYAIITKLIYPSIAMWVVSLLEGESGVFAVVSQDASQFIQNICTTSGLAFSILIGQTYYFMYQQQEKIYYAIYDEVAMAKMVLEQISLISRGRPQLYETILQQMDRYVRDDLQQLNDIDPATMLSSRPCDDPLEDILYLTSVGEPSQIYQSIRSLRQARAQRLGSLQMKLPEIQMTLLWILAAIVLLVFPLLGAGSQTIGGYAILQVQSWYISFLVFGISLVMGIIYELRSPNQPGAYNARTVLGVMINGLKEELQQRLQQSSILSSPSTLNQFGDTPSDSSSAEFAYFDAGPSIDGDGAF